MDPEDRIAAPISTAELERRWEMIRADMAERQIDALVMQNASDWLGGYVKWFTDIPATNGYPRSVVFFRDAPMTVVEMGPFDGKRDLEGRDPIHRGVGLRLHTPSFLSIDFTHGYEAELVLGALHHHGCRTVGLVGPGALPHGFATRLVAAFGAGIVDATAIVDRRKAIKSAEEIALIERCCAMQDAVFHQVLRVIRPGICDIDVTAAAQAEGQRLGSEQGIFLAASAPVGIRGGFQARHFQGRTLRAGDHLALLIENNGPGGFYAEIARTIVIGRASNELLEGFAAVEAAQRHTLANLRPGVKAADVAAKHDAYMVANGMPPEIRLYAHGQGYDMVERPMIRRDEDMTIEAGMCLAVHPGFETPSMFAVICDNYMIKADGPGPCLHRTEKKIFEV